jgi:hypothetical protein
LTRIEYHDIIGNIGESAHTSDRNKVQELTEKTIFIQRVANPEHPLSTHELLCTRALLFLWCDGRITSANWDAMFAQCIANPEKLPQLPRQLHVGGSACPHKTAYMIAKHQYTKLLSL